MVYRLFFSPSCIEVVFDSTGGATSIERVNWYENMRYKRSGVSLWQMLPSVRMLERKVKNELGKRGKGGKERKDEYCSTSRLLKYNHGDRTEFDGSRNEQRRV